MPSVREQWVELGAARVRYLEGGQGPALVFCHGNSSGADAFRPLIEQLAGSFRCLALDFYGHGGSTIPDASRCSVEGYAEMLCRFLQVLEVGACVLVGHSLGGHAAIEALPRVGGAVCGLVCISSPPFSVENLSTVFRDPVEGRLFRDVLTRADAELVASALVDRARIDASEFEAIVLRILSTRAGVRSRIGQAVSQGELADELAICAASRVPLMFVQGAQDPFVNQAYLPMLEAEWADRRFELCLIPDVQHCPHLEDPVRTTSAIRSFVGAIDCISQSAPGR